MLPPSSPEGTPEPNEEISSSVVDDSESILLTTEEDQPPKRHMKEIITSSSVTKEEEESAMVDDDVIGLQKSDGTRELNAKESAYSATEHVVVASEPTVVVNKESEVSVISPEPEMSLETSAVVTEAFVVTKETEANAVAVEPVIENDKKINDEIEIIPVSEKEEEEEEMNDSVQNMVVVAKEPSVVVAEEPSVVSRETTLQHSPARVVQLDELDGSNSLLQHDQFDVTQQAIKPSVADNDEAPRQNKKDIPQKQEQVDDTVKEENGKQQNAENDGIVSTEDMKTEQVILVKQSPADDKVIKEALVKTEDATVSASNEDLVLVDWQKKRAELTPKRQQFISDDQKNLEKDELKQDRVVLWQLHRDELAPRRDAFFKEDQRHVTQEMVSTKVAEEKVEKCQEEETPRQKKSEGDSETVPENNSGGVEVVPQVKHEETKNPEKNPDQLIALEDLAQNTVHSVKLEDENGVMPNQVLREMDQEKDAILDAEPTIEDEDPQKVEDLDSANLAELVEEGNGEKRPRGETVMIEPETFKETEVAEISPSSDLIIVPVEEDTPMANLDEVENPEKVEVQEESNGNEDGIPTIDEIKSVDIKVEESIPTLTDENETALKQFPPRSPKAKREEAINQAFHNITRAIDDAKHQVLVIEQIEEEPQSATIVSPEEQNQENEFTSVHNEEEIFLVNKNAKVVVFPRQHVEQIEMSKETDGDVVVAEEEQRDPLSSFPESEESPKKQADISKDDKGEPSLEIHHSESSDESENQVKEQEESIKIKPTESAEANKPKDVTCKDSVSQVLPAADTTNGVDDIVEDGKEDYISEQNQNAKKDHEGTKDAIAGTEKESDKEESQENVDEAILDDGRGKSSDQELVDKINSDGGDADDKTTPGATAEPEQHSSAPIAQSTPMVHQNNKQYQLSERSLADNSSSKDFFGLVEDDPVAIAQLLAFRNEEEDKEKSSMNLELDDLTERLVADDDAIFKNKKIKTKEEEVDKESEPANVVKVLFVEDKDMKKTQDAVPSSPNESPESHPFPESHFEEERPDDSAALQAFKREIESEVAKKEQLFDVSAITDDGSTGENGVQKQSPKDLKEEHSPKDLKDEHSNTAFDSGIVDETFKQTIVEDRAADQTLRDQLQTLANQEEKKEEAEIGSVEEGDENVKTHVTEIDSNSAAPVEQMYVVNKKQLDDDPLPLRVASLKSLRETDDSQYAQTPDNNENTSQYNSLTATPLEENTLSIRDDIDVPASLNLSTLKSINVTAAEGEDTDSELPKDTPYSGSNSTSDEEVGDGENLVPALPVDDDDDTPRHEQEVAIDNFIPIEESNANELDENKPCETSNYSYTGSSAQPSDEEGLITYVRVPPDNQHPASLAPRYIDDDVSYTDASFSEVEGVIHYQRLPPDDFKHALEEGVGNVGVDGNTTGAKSHIPTSPALLDSQPNKYTIDKKFVRFFIVSLFLLSLVSSKDFYKFFIHYRKRSKFIMIICVNGKGCFLYNYLFLLTERGLQDEDQWPICAHHKHKVCS